MATKLHLEDLSIGQIFKSPWADIDVGEIKGFATEFDRLPRLRRWPPTPRHVFGDCRLGNLESPHQEFAMDPRRAP
jgi:hypothetical protein